MPDVVDLETSGLLGYSSIFNAHLPRRGPLNLPILGLNVGGKTWVLCDKQPKRAVCTETQLRAMPDPVRMDLELKGVRTAEQIEYWGHYPVADLEFKTDAPIGVGLRAWSPFLPGDVVDSMLPGIVFEAHLRNTSSTLQEATIAFSFPGPTPNEAGAVEFPRRVVSGDFNGVVVSGRLASYAVGVIGKEKLRIGGELGADGEAWARIAKTLPDADLSRPGSSVAVEFALEPGKTKVVRFLLAWYAPTWNATGFNSAPAGNVFTHMYAKHYPDALSTAERLARDHGSLLKRVLAWQQAIYADGKLPIWLQDSLINILHLIAEDGMWAQARPPLPDWVRKEDGLFGMNECPRGCPQIECIPCSFYGNQPLVYFFPDLALSTLRGYKGYQKEDGDAPWTFGSLPSVDFARPRHGFQTTLNGPSYVVMVDRYAKCWGDAKFVSEFHESVKRNTIFTVNLRPEYSVGDAIISMPSRNIFTEGLAAHWFEAPEPGWFGMVPHVGGMHIAQIMIAQKMAEHLGDTAFAAKCRDWIEAGKNSLENKCWLGGHYLTFWEPESGKKSEWVFGYQLDGEWVARFHGLPGVFQTDRVGTTLRTIKRCNVALSKSGAVNYANLDGTIARPGGFGAYSYFHAELLMLAMLYIYEGEKEFGLELARRGWENLVCVYGYTWDLPNFVRGDQDTGERGGASCDYYQDMMLWSLPAAIEGKDVSGPLKPGGLVERVLRAARDSRDPVPPENSVRA